MEQELPPIPQLQVTDAALRQIQLIQRHDYTLEGMFFRIKIGGKGCGGFTYETGFSTPLADDLRLNLDGLTILMDRFTAYYTQRATLDHRVDTAANDEGFVVENPDAELYQGKFFKNTALVPPWEKKA